MLMGKAAIAHALLAPCPAERITGYPISRRITNVKNDDPACLEPLEER